MPGYLIRPAVREDAKVIRALIRAVRINPFGVDWERFLVAVDDGERLVGCGQVKAHRDGSRELASIAVVPDWRGKGVARALIEGLLSAHDPPLYLTCRDHLMGFYERFGFKVIQPADMPGYFRRIYRLVNLLGLISAGQADLLVMRR